MDPRQFRFALVCNVCHRHFNTTQTMRLHLQRECPSRYATHANVDLICGHCDRRVDHWPSLVRHLNQKDMHKQEACRPEYRVVMVNPPELSVREADRACPAITNVARRASRYNSLAIESRHDILSIAVEAAGLSTEMFHYANNTADYTAVTFGEPGSVGDPAVLYP